MNAEASMADIEAILSPLRADHLRFGTADLRGLLPASHEDTPYGISILRRLDPAIIDGISEGPTFAYREEHQRANLELRDLCNGIASALRRAGAHAVAVLPTVPEAQMDEEYLKTLHVPVSHKMLGTRAGLGWIGKTDLFVSHDFGPRLRMASVLTDLPLEPPAPPVERSLCGSCRRCVEFCPGRAASGKAWTAGMRREEFFDPHRCKQACRMQARDRLGIDMTLCGICISLCPAGRKKPSRT